MTTQKRKSRRRDPEPRYANRVWLWRGLVILGAVLAVTLTVSFLTTPLRPTTTTTSDTKGPRLVFDETRFDFGTVPLDEVVEHTFVYRNAGDAPLTVNENPRVETLEGCWPPRPVVGATTLQPGQSGAMHITTMMHAGMDGPHLFRITVKSNDPVSPETAITVKALFGP